MHYIAFHLVSESSDHYTFCLCTDFSEESLDQMKKDLECDVLSDYYWSAFDTLTSNQTILIEDMLNDVYEDSWKRHED